MKITTGRLAAMTFVIALLASVSIAQTIIVSVERAWPWQDSTMYNMVLSLTTANGKIFAATGGHYLQVSSDTGKTWKESVPPVASGNPNDAYVSAVAEVDSGKIVVGRIKAVSRSVGEGENIVWKPATVTVAYPQGFCYALSIFQVSGDTILIGGDGIIMSTNNGFSWFSVKEQDNLESFLVYSLARAPSGRILAGAYLYGTEGSETGDIFFSDNHGVSWETLQCTGLPDSVYVTAMTVDDASGVIFAATSYGLYSSENNGLAWTQINLPNRRFSSVLVSSSHVFAGADSALFYRLKDTEAWSEVAELHGLTAYALTEMDSNHVLVGTNSGMFIIHLSSSPVAINEDLTKPEALSLGQNYPNPFNPSTNITFSLPTSSMVTLIVHNVLGQEVARLVDRRLEAGYHSVRFENNQSGSGVYLYTLRAGDLILSKRMVIVR